MSSEKIYKLWNLCEILKNSRIDPEKTIDKKKIRVRNIICINNENIVFDNKSTFLWSKAIEPLKTTYWIPEKHMIICKKHGDKQHFYSPYYWEDQRSRLFLQNKLVVETTFFNGIGTNTEISRKIVPKEKIRDTSFTTEKQQIELDGIVLEIPSTQNKWKMVLVEDKKIVFNEQLRIISNVKNRTIDIEPNNQKKVKIIIHNIEVSNPIIKWLQPFTLVEWIVNKNDVIISNYIVIKTPKTQIHITSSRPIKLVKEEENIFFEVRGRTKISISKNDQLSFIKEWYYLNNSLQKIECTVPTIKILNESVFPYRFKAECDSIGCTLWLLLTNITEHLQPVITRIEPPYYIKDALILGNENEETIQIEKPNSLTLTLRRHSTTTIKLSVKKRKLAF